MIVCQNLRKQYHRAIALDDVSLAIPNGIFALLGPNGAGKSTLLKVLTGLTAPDSGIVAIAGRDVRDCKRIIGVVPEDLGLFDSLTIQEHLELSGPIYGLSIAETRSRAAALLRAFELERGRDTFLNQCSHGMRKKTALAMAILHNPEVLFLDEPFEGIDPVGSQTILHLLRYVAARGTTVFLTSHTLPLVEELTGQIAMMDHGAIVWRSANDARPFARVYFDLIQAAPLEELAWLGCAR